MPGQAWAEAVQKAANANADFAQAARWLDTKVLLQFGPARYWFKFYRGRIIDAAPYNPATNMLGYDVLVMGEPGVWRHAFDGTSHFARQFATGQIRSDGNRVEAERSYKAVYVLGSQVIEQCGLPPEMGP